MNKARYSWYMRHVGYGAAFAELAVPEWADNVGVSVRLYNCLKIMSSMGMNTSMEALRKTTDKELMLVKNMGCAMVRELRGILNGDTEKR